MSWKLHQLRRALQPHLPHTSLIDYEVAPFLAINHYRPGDYVFYGAHDTFHFGRIMQIRGDNALIKREFAACLLPLDELVSASWFGMDDSYTKIGQDTEGRIYLAFGDNNKNVWRWLGFHADEDGQEPPSVLPLVRFTNETASRFSMSLRIGCYWFYAWFRSRKSHAFASCRALQEAFELETERI